PFTVFDFDAYGSPWDQFTILAARRRLQPGERLGIVLTDGTWLKTRAKDPVRGLREALPRQLITPIPYSVHDELIARAVRRLAGRMGGRVTKAWSAIGVTGAKVRYLAVIVEAAHAARKPIRKPVGKPGSGRVGEVPRGGWMPPRGGNRLEWAL